METRPKPAVPAGSLALRGGDREAAAGGDAAGRPAEHREAPADGLDFLHWTVSSFNLLLETVCCWIEAGNAPDWGINVKM